MDKKKVEELIEQAIIWSRYANQHSVISNLEEALKELNKPDWVSVEDGLPPYDENVLAISKDGYRNVSYRRKIPRDKISREIMDDNGFILNFNLRCSTITHWKPIEKLEE